MFSYFSKNQRLSFFHFFEPKTAANSRSRAPAGLYGRSLNFSLFTVILTTQKITWFSIVLRNDFDMPSKKCTIIVDAKKLSPAALLLWDGGMVWGWSFFFSILQH